MSRTVFLSTGALGALGLALALPSFAADNAVGAGCSNVTFNAEFLEAYPRAPAACQEVVTKDGKQVAYAELRKGDKLDFRGPENDVGACLDPASTALHTIVLP